jgi:hypothetical protein
MARRACLSLSTRRAGEPDRRIRSTRSFRVISCVDSFSYENWSVRLYEPLPRLHRPARWDAERFESYLKKCHSRSSMRSRVPTASRVIGGRCMVIFVPWNLREDSLGQLWLLDWEDAGWGPPLADFVRYVVAYYSLGWRSPARIAAVVTKAVGPELLPALAEVASFWLSHPNIDPGEGGATVSRRRARDSARAARELAAFRVIGARAADVGSISPLAVRLQPTRTAVDPRIGFAPRAAESASCALANKPLRNAHSGNSSKSVAGSRACAQSLAISQYGNRTDGLVLLARRRDVVNRATTPFNSPAQPLLPCWATPVCATEFRNLQRCPQDRNAH